MTRHLLDTNILIYAYSGVPAILDHLANRRVGELATSTLSYSEFLIGRTKAADSGPDSETIELIATHIDILPFDRAAAETYGRIMLALPFSRRRAFDRMIAAHALSAGLTLVTNNPADFDDIPDLKLERWPSER